MALETKAYGLHAHKSELPGTPPTMVAEFPVANGYATALYAGDPISLSGGTAKKFATTETPQGVARSFRYIDANGTPRYTKILPASTTQSGTLEGFQTPVVQVEIAAGGLYELLTDGTVAAADLGKFYTLNLGTAGDDIMGQSSVTMNVASGNAALTGKDVQFVGLVKEPGNDYGNTIVKVVVRFVKTPINQ